MEVRLANGSTDLSELCAILAQLRPRFEPEALQAKVRDLMRQGYRLAYLIDRGGRVLCVAGFVIGEKLAWGKHLYIDDLVTDESARSGGAGRFMLDWLKDYAQTHGCREIHLESGVQRFGAHSFYLREGFRIASHHFVTEYLDTGFAGGDALSARQGASDA